MVTIWTCPKSVGSSNTQARCEQTVESLKIESMKRATLAGLADLTLYLSYRGLSTNLSSYSLPDDGVQMIGQTLILGLLAATVLGTVVALTYRLLNWIFD